MSKVLLSSDSIVPRPKCKSRDTINICELFMDTIQGENFTGVPCSFLRLSGCTLNCVWCDTKDQWKKKLTVDIDWLLDYMGSTGMVARLKRGQILVITGGSPLLQQDKLIKFLQRFIARYDFKPFVEIENECVLEPKNELINLVSRWNNSPKLNNSENPFELRFRPKVIQLMGMIDNSWFKFVISRKRDWDEIYDEFIEPGYIPMNRIVLMPLGQTKEELDKTREEVVNIAIENNVRFSDRLHVTIWDNKKLV